MATLVTQEYGTLEYDPSDLIHFPDGIFGFQDLHDYLPLCFNEQEDETMLLYLSVDNPKIGFVIINPFALDPAYHPVLSEEEIQYLGADDPDSLMYYVLCVLKDDYLDNTVNMKCPLVINPATRTGMQVILYNTNYGMRHTLRSFLQPEESEKDQEKGQTIC